MPLHNQLLIGLQDIFHPAWQNSYFPDECPDDWRFTYYSNDFRAVWLPAGFLSQPRAILRKQLDTFCEDKDSHFYFLLSLSYHELAAFPDQLAQLDTITNQIATLVLDVPPESACIGDHFNRWRTQAESLASRYPIAINQPASDSIQPDMLASLAIQNNWSQVWHASDSTLPAEGGEFLPVIGNAQALRSQRIVIEKIADWMGNARNAGLFFPINTTPANAALDAKSLAEIMGV